MTHPLPLLVVLSALTGCAPTHDLSSEEPVNGTEELDGVSGDSNEEPRAYGSVSIRRSGGDTAPWVFLDGQDSFDPDGDPLHFTWSFASRPAESSLNLTSIEGQGEELAAFRPDAPGTWTLRLTVSDLNVSSTTILEDIYIDQATWDYDLPTD